MIVLICIFQDRMNVSDVNDKTSKSLHVQDAHSRLNFLHQGSIFVSSQGKSFYTYYCWLFMISGLSNNDAYAKLSRQMIRNFREILNTERVKVDPQILRSFCGQCKQVFVAKVGICKN